MPMPLPLSPHPCLPPMHACLPSADSLLRLLRALVGQAGWPLAEALPLMTSNPAAVLKLPHKGRLAVGADADVLLLEVRACCWGRAAVERHGAAGGAAARVGILERSCASNWHLVSGAGAGHCCFWRGVFTARVGSPPHQVPAKHSMLTPSPVHPPSHPRHPTTQPSSLEVRYVIAQGRVVKTPEWTLGGMFERGPGIRPKQPPTEAG